MTIQDMRFAWRISLPDDDAKQEGYLRVIDESGEDYLYPESYFILIQLPHEAQEALRITA
ncbi:MAG: hypothetical protein JRJ69_17905 [Deltaproteobacteria bacterium]|nr:hypothetical protein [Deltaproteobacteria bacterium]